MPYLSPAAYNRLAQLNASMHQGVQMAHLDEAITVIRMIEGEAKQAQIPPFHFDEYNRAIDLLLQCVQWHVPMHNPWLSSIACRNRCGTYYHVKRMPPTPGYSAGRYGIMLEVRCPRCNVASYVWL